MTAPMNIGGLSSGVQWNDIVDATVKAMEARTVTLTTNEIDLKNKQKDAWTTLQNLTNSLNDAAYALRRAGFGGYEATLPASPSTGRSLFSAAPTQAATAGRYRVEVVQLADTAKLGGISVSDTAAAQGLNGSFTVNGSAIVVESTDSLETIRNKINDAATGVMASIISEGGTAGHLVLTSAASGSTGIELVDGAEGLGRELGFLDSRSRPISSANAAAAAALGLPTYPSPAAVRIGGVVVTIDLENESLASIAAKINAAGGAASVQSELYGDETRYRLVMDGNVSAVNGDPQSQAVIDALGIGVGASGRINQIVQSGAFTDASDAPATTSTVLAGLKVDGADVGLAVGDAINIRGLRGDGSAVSFGLVVNPGDTIQDLLDRINDAASGFGAGSRTASAELGPDGRIRLVDGSGGASRLSFSLGVTHEDGSSGSLGLTSVSVTGRDRQLQEGRDAIVRVDGQEYVRTSNTFADVVAGVSITLQSAEPGTTIDLAIDRNEQGAVDAAKKLVDAYNSVRDFYEEQRKPDAPLYADSGLRRLMDQFTDALHAEVADNDTYRNSVGIGLHLDRFGKLSLSEEEFRKAFADRPGQVETLLGSSGIGGAFLTYTDAASRYGVGTISGSINNILNNIRTLQKRETEQKARIEDRRLQLIQQFTKMEEALGRLQQQSGSLLASVSGLQMSRS